MLETKHLDLVKEIQEVCKKYPKASVSVVVNYGDNAQRGGEKTYSVNGSNRAKTCENRNCQSDPNFYVRPFHTKSKQTHFLCRDCRVVRTCMENFCRMCGKRVFDTDDDAYNFLDDVGFDQFVTDPADQEADQGWVNYRKLISVLRDKAALCFECSAATK